LRLSSGRLGVGLAAGAGAVFAGNLAGAFDAWSTPFVADFDYWHASRLIGPENFKTINEFPFFTFFHADLHPHLLAFPFFIAAFVVAHRWVEAGNENGSAGGRRCCSWRSWPARRARPTSGTCPRWRSSSWPAACSGRPAERVCPAPVRRSSEVSPAPRSSSPPGCSSIYTSSFVLESNGLGRTTMFSGLIEFAGVWGILLAVCALGLWPRPRTIRKRRGAAATSAWR
jgi:hypothetical protein